ncbi:glycosyltransferase [Clostridium sp. ZS6]|uniref:glycosyltransferase n=1 Tax=Clostridium sp. ZS6 TaxID=2949987 RepID=UPI00207A226F|nr:glycosyltransferase [Clostridium sp. ZS6]
MQVSVIIAVYNRASLLNELLEQWRKIDKETRYEYELIFSDDDSADNSVEILKGCNDLPIRVLENTHGGASKARNHAYKYATGEIVIFTGDDIFPSVDFINNHYETYLKNGENFATLGRIEWRDGIEINHLMKHITDIGCEQFGFVGMKPYEIIDFRHFYTSNISVSRKKLQQLDCLFDTTFKKYGFEDVELGYRLFKNGVNIFYNPSIICFHDHVYNSVEKFCNRQLSAGEELNTFKKLHPELSYDDIKLDIDNFIQLFEQFSKQDSFFDVSSDFIRLGIKVSKYFTKILEKIISKTNSNALKKVCSYLYRIIFCYSMNVGLAMGNENCKPVKKRTAERFAIKYLSNGQGQMFFDTDNNFTEEYSQKYYTVGRKRITLQFDFKNQIVGRIRFDPLDTFCKIKLINAEAILKDESRTKIKFEFTNASFHDEENYNFSKEQDPILISEVLPKGIKGIEISYDINYVNLKKIIKFSKKALKYSSKAVKKIIKYKRKPKSIEKQESVSNIHRKIWIHVNYKDSKCLNRFKEYQSICTSLKDVVIKDTNCMEDGYQIYEYNISNAKNSMEKSQFFNAVFCLLRYNYDFILLSDSLEYFPMIHCNTLSDTMIISKKIGSVEGLSKDGIEACGKYIRIPGSKRIENVIDISNVIPNMRCVNETKLLIGKDVSVEFSSKCNVQQINKNKSIILVLPVFMAVGGVERNTAEVMSRLHDIYDFVVISFERHRPEQGSLYYQIADLTLMYSDLAEISGFDQYLNIIKNVKEIYKPDLVWICNSSPWFMDHCSDIRNIFNDVPIVTQDVYDYQHGWIEYYNRPGIHSYDRFIAVNQKIKEKFINEYAIPQDNIDLVYSAIDISKVTNLNTKDFSKEYVLNKFGLKSDKIYFTFIGRFTEQKQTHKIVELAKYAVEKYNDNMDFIMVGDGELSDNVDQLIDNYGLQERVHRFKYIANTVEFLKCMDGILITSIFEGLPIVTIEAMCVGTPILATDVGDLSLFVETYNIGVISKSQEMNDIQVAFNEFLLNLNCYKKNTKKSATENIRFFSSERAANLMNESFVKAMDKYNNKYMKQESEK